MDTYIQAVSHIIYQYISKKSQTYTFKRNRIRKYCGGVMDIYIQEVSYIKIFQRSHGYIYSSGITYHTSIYFKQVIDIHIQAESYTKILQRNHGQIYSRGVMSKHISMEAQTYTFKRNHTCKYCRGVIDRYIQAVSYITYQYFSKDLQTYKRNHANKYSEESWICIFQRCHVSIYFRRVIDVHVQEMLQMNILQSHGHIYSRGVIHQYISEESQTYTFKRCYK